MIKLITENFNEIISPIPESHNKNKILSLYQAYKTTADFCRFYTVSENDKNSIACVFGNSLIYADNQLENYAELAAFASACNDISLKTDCAFKIMEYINEDFEHQTLDINVYNGKIYDIEDINKAPSLQKAYEIIASGFDNIDFDFWYVDMSHRIRHGISKTFTYQNSSTATVQFDTGKEVFLSQIATLPQMQKKGLASALLRQIATRYTKENKLVYLFAKPKLREFYNHTGFDTKGEFSQLTRK